MVYVEKCVIRRRTYPDDIQIYDVISKSDISLTKRNYDDVDQLLPALESWL